MKKMLFALMLSLFAMQANAVSISLDTDGQTKFLNAEIPGDGFGPHEMVLGGNPSGSLWETSLSIIDLTAGSVTNFSAEVINNITGAITTVLPGTTGGITLPLALGNYTVNFLGTPGPSTFGLTLIAHVEEIQTSAVPVPAAVWLFGSALMGLIGVSRRKSTSVAA